MSGATALGIRYPQSTDSPPDVSADMQRLASDVDSLLTPIKTKPRFHLVQTGTAQNIANAVATAVTFNTEVYDTANGHDTVTNTTRYTVPTGLGGLWLIGGKMSWDGNTTGRRIGWFLVNAVSIVPGSYISVPPAATATLMPMETVPVVLSAGDYIELIQQQDSGGTRTTFNGGSDSGACFWGIRQGD